MTFSAHFMKRSLSTLIVIGYLVLITLWVLPFHYSTFYVQTLGRDFSLMLLGIASLPLRISSDMQIAAILLLIVQALLILAVIHRRSGIQRKTLLTFSLVFLANSVCGACLWMLAFTGTTGEVVRCQFGNQTSASVRVDTFLTGLDGFIYFVSHRPNDAAEWSTVFVRTTENARSPLCDRMGISTTHPDTQWLWIDTDLAVTHDNGQSWQVQSKLENWIGRHSEGWSYISSVQFEDDTVGRVHIIARDGAEYVFHTTDGGVTWLNATDTDFSN